MRGWPKAVERDRGPGVVGGADTGTRCVVGHGRRPRDSGGGRQRGAPLGSTSRAPGLPDMVRRTRSAVAATHAEDVFLYSAALAFYGLISVAPLVVVALWVTSLLVGPTQIDQAAGRPRPPQPPGTRRRPGARTGRRPWGLARSGGCGRRHVASDRLRVCVGTSPRPSRRQPRRQRSTAPRARRCSWCASRPCSC